MTFENLFKTKDSKRDKFFSKIFGIFSEEIVGCWGDAPQAPYKNLGRPTIRRIDEPSPYHTLDFTLESKDDKRVYVAEMKCEIEYDRHRYFVLESPNQLDHHNNDNKPAFKAFLNAAQNPSQYRAKVGKQVREIDGAILIWGQCTEQGRADTMTHYRFADVLSVEKIIRDLITWQNDDYKNLIQQYQIWCGELFTGLRNLK